MYSITSHTTACPRPGRRPLYPEWQTSMHRCDTENAIEVPGDAQLPFVRTTCVAFAVVTCSVHP